MYDDVLVPTDGRENTDRAIDEAIALADAHDARLHVLYVINSAAIAPGVDFEALQSVGEQAVTHVADLATAAGLERVETTVTHGLRHRAILEYVDDRGVDVIVMGRNRGLERFLLGGVSDRVSEGSPVPVLVVNA